MGGSSRDLPAGGGVRRPERHHPPDRRARRACRHRAAQRHLSRRARQTPRLTRRKRRAPGAPLTVRDHWRRITRRFAAARLAFGHGTRTARDEAAWLVCSALGIAFDDLAAALDRPIEGASARRLEELADLRIESRTPLAYLLKEAWLEGHRFYVDERVIVPRSHIAALLGDGLATWLESPASSRSDPRPVHRLGMPGDPGGFGLLRVTRRCGGRLRRGAGCRTDQRGRIPPRSPTAPRRNRTFLPRWETSASI